MEITISKIGAAAEQMDWAIRLLIDHDAHLPAITLAGAAEEIVGAALKEKSTFAQLADKLSIDFGLPRPKVTQDHLNKARNWLKHWHDHPAGDTLTLDPEAEAIQQIIRALTNLATYDSSWPSQGPRFAQWLTDHHPELME